MHQEIALCPDVTVAENVLMSEIARSRAWFVNYGKIRRRAATILSKLTSLSPDMRLGSLSISNQQLVEICRALSQDCEILILDEPTAALTQSETEALFRLLRELRDQGVAIIYISHRMSEIYKLCDRITVLRDGRRISTDNVADVTPDEVVQKLIGRKLEALYPPKSRSPDGPVLMQVSGLSDGKKVHDVSFTLRRGEVLGIAGLIGSGRSELLHAICGLKARASGRVTLADGADFSPQRYSDAVRKGVVCLSEDRKIDGVFLNLSIAQNTSSMRISQVSTRYGFVEPASGASAGRDPGPAAEHPGRERPAAGF